MSSPIQAPLRSLLRALRSGSQRPACQCTRPKRLSTPQQQRCLSSTTTQQDDFAPQTPAPELPRWAQTPPAMKAPLRTRAKKSDWREFAVNGDPSILDAMYSSLLGRSGPKMLSDETKWLAVTHKSFDAGRRGFNDRLSFLGRQIVELQTSLALLTAADMDETFANTRSDPYGRQPFHHPATDNVEILNAGQKESYITPKVMTEVASRYGLPGVVRWLPKDINNLEGSGSSMVYTQALFAIIGALALEQGGLIANQIARERILQPLGFKVGVKLSEQKGQRLST